MIGKRSVQGNTQYLLQKKGLRKLVLNIEYMKVRVQTAVSLQHEWCGEVEISVLM